MIKSIFLILPLILTGCATYNETFDCEPGRGVGCQSLSQVNRLVDEGKLPFSEEKPVTPINILSSQQKFRIWVAGHTDEEGVTHEPAILYVPLENTKRERMIRTLSSLGQKVAALLGERVDYGVSTEAPSRKLINRYFEKFPFSTLLPYQGYDPAKGLFYNTRALSKLTD